MHGIYMYIYKVRKAYLARTPLCFKGTDGTRRRSR
jgi:hypothetical protein